MSPQDTRYHLTFLYRYGTIKSAKAIVDRVTGKCKGWAAVKEITLTGTGYGFVMFDETSAAQAALDGLITAGHPAAFAKISYGDRYVSTPRPMQLSHIQLAVSVH